MKTNFLKFLKAGLYAGIMAAFINVVLYLIFVQTSVMSSDVLLPDGNPMTIFPILISSIVPSILAGAFFYLLKRYTKNGYRIFLVIAVILLIASFANPFMVIENLPFSYALALNLMHVVVVGCLLFWFEKITERENHETVKPTF